MTEAERGKDKYLATKYSSPRDEVLGEMGLQGWANASGGNVEAPTGYFERITNTEAELIEIAQAFAEEIAEASRYGFTPAELLGHFLLITSNEGFVTIVEYPTHETLVEQFDLLEAAYSEWGGDDARD